MKRLGRIFLAAFAACLLFCSAGSAADGKIRLGVMRFSSKAESLTDAQAGIITDMFIHALAGSKSIVVVDRDTIESIGDERQMSLSGLSDPSDAAEIGRLAGLQYVMLGFISEFEKETKSQTASFGIGQNIPPTKATIQARVVDVNTSEVVMALSETGISSNHSTALSVEGYSMAQSGGMERESVHAIQDAVWRMAHLIRAEIAEEYSYVVSENGGKFTIDVGLILGVNPGSLYLAYSEGHEILGIDGKPLGRAKIPLAVIRVNRSEAGYSVCSAILGNGDVVRRGDKIEPITADDAKKIAPELPKKRPEF
ncbi:MAG: CsgG/HfaB family protein [Synergistaceae bacterium]|jgi:curli biogenesis system outer membrane secretion channel CsgG|nr:CsgG/HfaB family protein [Synergistaceae bacterium]